MFLKFQKYFNNSVVFSVKDIDKAFPGFNKMNLVNWQKNSRIIKLRNGWYRLNQNISEEAELFYIANKIYSPSYISMESALSYYGFIPEGVFTLSSVSTLKTQKFETPIGSFKYQNLKTPVFFGYSLINYKNFTIKIAGPEKALLDFLYLNHTIKESKDLESIRLNKIILSEKLDLEKLGEYARHFHSNEMLRKKTLLLQYIND
jgi:predicted transcriptional regulator of viral defense system